MVISRLFLWQINAHYGRRQFNMYRLQWDDPYITDTKSVAIEAANSLCLIGSLTSSRMRIMVHCCMIVIEVHKFQRNILPPQGNNPNKLQSIVEWTKTN